MMKIGNLQTKASSPLSTFVLACSIVTVGLLFVMQKAQKTADALSFEEYSVSIVEQY